MSGASRSAELLEALRKPTFQSRGEFFRKVERLYEWCADEREVIKVLRQMELLKFVSIDRVGKGTHSHIVSLRMTEAGLFQLVKMEMMGIVKEQRAEYRVQNTGVGEEKREMSGRSETGDGRAKAEPCGVVRKVCYSSGSCYLAWKCNAKKN